MTTVPVTRTAVAGEVVLASHFNNNFRDPLNFLLAPPLLQCRQIVAQSLTNNTFVALTYTAEDVDSSGMHSTVTNTSRAVAVYPGWYRWSGVGGFDANGTGVRGVRWAKNGTAIDNGGPVLPTVSGTVSVVPVTTTFIFLNVGDYAELQALQSSGGALNTSVLSTAQSTMSGAWESN